MDGAPSEGRFVIIDRERKLFVGLQGAARLQDLAGHEPVHGRKRATALVVRRNDEIDVPHLVVRVAQRDDRDSDVQRFSKRLLIRRRVRDEEDLRLHELREVRIREGTRYETAGEDLRSDVFRKETRGLLAVLARRDDEDVLRLEPGEELRRVSESVPIWFGLIRIALPARSSIPRRNRSTFVTKMSSPMTLQRSPMRRVRSANAPKSSWSNGSSTLNSP